MQPLNRLTGPLIALLLFLSASALYGGYLLTVDPTGRRLQMSTTLLAGTPFTDFRLPGLFLFVGLGMGPLVPLIGHLAHARWSVLASLAIGLTLLVWIIIQVALLGYTSWLQPAYAAVGVALAVLSFRALPHQARRKVA